MKRHPKTVASTLTFIALLFTQTLLAEALPERRVVIENHRFVPETIVAPSDTKFRLIVENRDATAEEFESYSLGREKVVKGHSSITVFLGPLKPGSYDFFGDFNADTAQGQIVVK